MLSVIWSKKKDSNLLGLSKSLEDENQGLRILTRIGDGNPKILLKPVFSLNHRAQENHSCFLLKSCHLCHKTLTLDKEVYMYRGDLGFCSVQCRERQMFLDEMKEIEISTKKILASFHQRRHLRPADGSAGRCETRKLSEEFRQRRHPFSSQNNQVIFS
ncbi:hypothetical protein F511_09714 [Dorcoceras hygrometricum]|uniref:FLZ-type domain-containing protein n=1 Tax=Dorcoceras hygrometricum TaxID=472368 RepID=A0A2Z7CVR5_9LAMI|nr:hypothetical protein F511_09714 [Dorcoceras hygrometricum]